MVSYTDALPSFPLPSRPDAPSRAELALQGLDKALLGARIVDPSLAIPVDELGRVHDLSSGDLPVLSDRMRKRLKEIGINEFFAVQAALLPFLLPSKPLSRALYCPYNPPQDVCVSAPTGSGKTLAYAIPIVETLASRIAVRLRALVVLPTRDLALQVQETFEAISKGRGLKIGVVTGQHSFAHEQNQLVNHEGDETCVSIMQRNHCFRVGKSAYTPIGGSSNVDILICTPGRLIDHLTGTPGFTLQHLRFLVIDEADRLLMHSFQGWSAHVLTALRLSAYTSRGNQLDMPEAAPLMASVSLPSHDAVAPPILPNLFSDLDDPRHSSCQKLLFSATLTRTPSNVATLGLRNPKYFVVQSLRENDAGNIEEASKLALVSEGFEMPVGLKEHYLVTSAGRKPLILFYLIHERGISNALVFTKSAASTGRLVKLFEFFEDAYHLSVASSEPPLLKKCIIAQAYSSDLPSNERRSILERFKREEIDILICSDLVSRGLDISHVSHVVSYDVPVDIRKYVHRVGRTARAGRSGEAWTLVEEQEAHFFISMLRDAGCRERVAKERIKDRCLKPMEDSYQAAMDSLREFYSRFDQ